MSDTPAECDRLTVQATFCDNLPDSVNVQRRLPQRALFQVAAIPSAGMIGSVTPRDPGGGESLDTLAANTPNRQASADEYYGVMKLTLLPDGYRWSCQSAMESPTAPDGTPATYGDSGAAVCNGQRF